MAGVNYRQRVGLPADREADRFCGFDVACLVCAVECDGVGSGRRDSERARIRLDGSAVNLINGLGYAAGIIGRGESDLDRSSATERCDGLRCNRVVAQRTIRLIKRRTAYVIPSEYV